MDKRGDNDVVLGHALNFSQISCGANLASVPALNTHDITITIVIINLIIDVHHDKLWMQWFRHHKNLMMMVIVP